MRKLTLLFAGLAAAGLGLLYVPAAEPGVVGIDATKEHISFKVGSGLVGKYNIAPTWAKPFMWPVHGPGGITLTRAYPMLTGQPGETADHPHQKSLWFCHGDVIPEGIELKDPIKGVRGVDFWSEAKGHGRIVCTEVGAPKLDKAHGQVTTKNEWRTADGTKIMDEVRTIHLYDFGDARLFVFDIDLHASVAAITFGDTKEGSFGVRINDLIREAAGKGKLENADGKVGEKALWGHKSAWCDYSGTIESKPETSTVVSTKTESVTIGNITTTTTTTTNASVTTVTATRAGIALFDDPENANAYPACWHSRGYGLMAANPFGRDKSFPGQKGNSSLVKLAKGEHLKLRYGVLLHSGDAKDGKVADYFQRFVKLKS